MTTITVENVSKQFRLREGDIIQAVDDVSLKVSEGGTIAIIGPSGCGKTTLLRMIAGLEAPDEGNVLYNDEPLEAMPKRERGIGMVFQNYALIPQWDAEQNIGFFLRLRQRELEVPERVQTISKITGVGIKDLMTKRPRDLSGGEKQRVAIARAFARDLKVLLFDEPFANLDAKLRQESRTEARRLLSKFPVTTIYVTHDQQEASVMADRIILMNTGKIIQVGSYQSLYDSPATLFVAGFIGVPTINLIEGVVQEGTWYHEDFGRVPLPAMIAENAAVTLGIRPEHMQLGGEIIAKVDQATPYYAERFILLDVFIGGSECQIQIPFESQIQKGETIHCGIDLQKALFFDTHTGERIT